MVRHEDGTLMKALALSESSLAPLTYKNSEETVGHLQPGRELSQDTESVRNLIVGFPAPRTVGTEISVVYNPQSIVFLLLRTEKTKTECFRLNDIKQA